MNKGNIRTSNTKPIPVPGKSRRSRAKGVVTHTQLNGGKYKPSTNPPDVTAQPWYPLTLAWVNRPEAVTFTKVVDIFKRQLDPQKSGLNQRPFASSADDSFRFQFRLKRIAVWNLNGKALSLSVYDDLEQNNTDKDQLGGWTDCGGQSYFPTIGFIYPYSHSNRVHRPDELLKDTVVFTTTASGSGDSILTHLSILWRFDGSVRALSVLPSREEEILDEIKEVATSIKEQQPSAVQRVLDGVRATASVVTLASAGFARQVSNDGDIDALVDLVLARLALKEISVAAQSEDGVSSFTSA